MNLLRRTPEQFDADLARLRAGGLSGLRTADGDGRDTRRLPVSASSAGLPPHRPETLTTRSRACGHS